MKPPKLVHELYFGQFGWIDPDTGYGMPPFVPFKPKRRQRLIGGKAYEVHLRLEPSGDLERFGWDVAETLGVGPFSPPKLGQKAIYIQVGVVSITGHQAGLGIIEWLVKHWKGENPDLNYLAAIGIRVWKFR